ncbi:unnamed protein product [Penicillium salamii]|nr:unnamed protein product [Penicillium salamii]
MLRKIIDRFPVPSTIDYTLSLIFLISLHVTSLLHVFASLYFLSPLHFFSSPTQPFSSFFSLSPSCQTTWLKQASGLHPLYRSILNKPLTFRVSKMPVLSKEAILPERTDIDRSKCTRVVPMRVLGLGLSRTGTNSLRSALRTLGYDDTYHGFAAFMENPRDCEMWLKALEAKFHGQGKPFGREEFDQLLGHCQAVTDIPAVCFAPELIQAYPEAKVILTHRDIDVWHASVMETIIDQVDNPFTNMATRYFLRFCRSSFQLPRKVSVHVCQDFYQDFKLNGRQIYREHYALVDSLVPEGNLLHYRIEEGWEPLCRFLGQPIPDVPFPYGNTAAEVLAKTRAFIVVELMHALWRFCTFLVIVVAILVSAFHLLFVFKEVLGFFLRFLWGICYTPFPVLHLLFFILCTTFAVLEVR